MPEPLIIDARAPHCMASVSHGEPGSAHSVPMPAAVVVAVKCTAERHIIYCSLCESCYRQMRPDWHKDARRLCGQCNREGIITRGGTLLEAIPVKAAG